MARKIIPAINESELDTEEKPIVLFWLWIKEHMTAVFIGAAVLLIIAIFFGMSIYKDASQPLAKFMAASAKNFNASFSFEVEAIENGTTVVQYSGAYVADPSKQAIKALYDADYNTYTYQGVVYSEGNTHLSGNLYKGKWRVRDCSDKVLNFFDFNTDYKEGRFDAASFLRFTDLTSSFSAKELHTFMKLFKSRMDGNSPLAKVTTTSGSGIKNYQFDIDLQEFFDMVRDNGASIFLSAIDYDAFCALYEENREAIDKAACRFTFSVNGAGWLTEMNLSVNTGSDDFSVHCSMSDFGTVAVTLPDEFFKAAMQDTDQ